MADVTRRTLLRGAAVIGVAVPVITALDTSPSDATARLSRSSFSPLVGKSFKVRGAKGPATLTLDAVTDLPNAMGADMRRFSLQFRQTAGPGLGQGTWLVRQASLGEFHLFVVPIGNVPGRFEAVFNCV